MEENELSSLPKYCSGIIEDGANMSSESSVENIGLMVDDDEYATGITVVAIVTGLFGLLVVVVVVVVAIIGGLVVGVSVVTVGLIVFNLLLPDVVVGGMIVVMMVVVFNSSMN